MKRKFFCIACSALLTMIASVTYAGSMIGVKGGYFVWRPYFKDVNPEWNASMKNGSGMLSGPVISISLTDDLAITVAGLFGTQEVGWDVEEPDNHTKYSVKTKRYDIDSALNYTITPNVKFFIGYKYQYFDSEIIQFRSWWNNSGYVNQSDYSLVTSQYPSHGVAAGIGLGLPLTETYFVTGNMSFIYFVKNSSDMKMDITTRTTSSVNYEMRKVSLDATQFGVNFEPSVGAKISESVIGTLGARLVWTRMKEKEDHPNDYIKKGDVWNDYLYGIFVSVMYML